MGEEKLTKAQRELLRFFLDNDGSKYRPAGFARVTLDRLVSGGHLRREAPPFGMARHFVTESGRAALKEASNG
jgi:hypothetical protein